MFELSFPSWLPALPQFSPGHLPMDLYVTTKSDVTLDPLPLLSADPEVEAPQPGGSVWRPRCPY